MNKKQILKKIENYVIKIMKTVKEESHGFRHVDRVRKWALKIAKKEGNMDLFLIEIAALLHDIGRAKADRRNHCKVGAKMTEDYLCNLKYFKNKEIDLICNAVREHGSGGKSKFSKIIQDADCMDLWGAISVGRAFSHLYNKPHYIDKNSFNFKKLNKKEIHNQIQKGQGVESVIDDLVQSLAIYDNINTKTAKNMAKEKVNYLKGFIKQFKKETIDL